MNQKPWISLFFYKVALLCFDEPQQYVGMYHHTIGAPYPWGLPLNIKLLPQYLQANTIILLFFKPISIKKNSGQNFQWNLNYVPTICLIGQNCTYIAIFGSACLYVQHCTENNLNMHWTFFFHWIIWFEIFRTLVTEHIILVNGTWGFTNVNICQHTEDSCLIQE